MHLDTNSQDFFTRSVGVVIHEAKVLCHRDLKEDFWVLPGGTCAFGEDSKTCLTREFREDLGAAVSIGRLLWVAENFFQSGGKSCHEIGLYHELVFKSDSRGLTKKEEFLGFEVSPTLTENDKGFSIQFRWIPLTSISSYDLRPAFLRTELLNPPPMTRHLVCRDRL